MMHLEVLQLSKVQQCDFSEEKYFFFFNLIAVVCTFSFVL